MDYTVTWNDGEVDRYPMERYTLPGLRELVRGIGIATHGAYTATIGAEEDKLC